MSKSSAISFPDLLIRWLDDKYPDAFRLTNYSIHFCPKGSDLASEFQVGETLPTPTSRHITYEGTIERKSAVYGLENSHVCAYVLNCGIICRTKDGKKTGINNINRELFDKLEVHFNEWL